MERVHEMSDNEDSPDSYVEEPLSIARHIRTLQHSVDRDAILDAIEELRTQARGNGTLKCSFLSKILLSYQNLALQTT